LAGRPLPDPPEWMESYPKWTSKDNLLAEGDDLFIALYDFKVREQIVKLLQRMLYNVVNIL